MSGFENYSREAADIELEIERKGIALGIDWNDEVQVRTLAQEALKARSGEQNNPGYGDTEEQRTRVDLFGLAQLMLTVMRESADENMLTHGGPVWKIFGRALWLEARILGLISRENRVPKQPDT